MTEVKTCRTHNELKRTATRAGFKVRGLRWWIVGLISSATLINYIDRVTIICAGAGDALAILGLTIQSLAASLPGFSWPTPISQGLSGSSTIE